MKWQIRRATKLLREGGPLSLLKGIVRYLLPPRIYNNKIWSKLPTTNKYGTYNGVEVIGTHPMMIDDPSGIQIEHRIFDQYVPWDTPSYIPNFKQPNVEQIHDNYRSGDSIVIIGGGNGVSAVHSAKQVGPDGTVIIYEADDKRIIDLEKTLKQNDVWDICEINHAIVGQAHLVESPGDADVVDPAALPLCNALEMDCEGAELNILRDLTQTPEKIIVELHHEKPYSPYTSADTIRQILTDIGYSVERYDGPWVNGLLVARIP